MKSIILIWMILFLGCKKQDSSDVVQLYIPNAFYPNSNVQCPSSDPVCNRNFTIKFSDRSKLHSFEMYIYNSNQIEVYHTTIPEYGWNGRSQNIGAECAYGTYPYLIRYTDINQEVFIVSGNVLLIR